METLDNKKPSRSTASSDVFVVNVKMRKNATWQGSVKYAGAAEEINFRSTLELIKIIDGTLTDKYPDEEE